MLKAQAEIAFTGHLVRYERYEWRGDYLANVGEVIGLTKPFDDFPGLFVEFARLCVAERVPDQIARFCEMYGYWPCDISYWIFASEWMKKSIDAWMAGEAIPELPAGVTASQEPRMQERITVHATAGTLTVKAEVADLWSIVSAQFNVAVSEGSLVRDCDRCGRAYLVSPPVSRKTRKYCSDYCRGAAFRERKDNKDVAPKKRKPQTKRTGRGRSPKDK